MKQNGSEPEPEPDKLEELNALAAKIQDFRATLPEHVSKTLPSLIQAQRPVSDHGSDPGTSGAPVSDTSEFASDKDALGDQTFQRITLLQEKVSHNVAALPIILKRLRECMTDIDKLDSQNMSLHPAIKQRRAS